MYFTWYDNILVHPCCCKWCWEKSETATPDLLYKGNISTLTPAAAAAKSLQLCPTLCDPIDGSPPGSPVPGILQARTLEWVAIPFSSAWKWKVKMKWLSPVWPSATPWTAAFQASPSMGFSKQEYWSGVPLPSLFYVLVIFFSKTYRNKYIYTV